MSRTNLEVFLGHYPMALVGAEQGAVGTYLLVAIFKANVFELFQVILAPGLFLLLYFNCREVLVANLLLLERVLPALDQSQQILVNSQRVDVVNAVNYFILEAFEFVSLGVFENTRFTVGVPALAEYQGDVAQLVEALLTILAQQIPLHLF